MDPDSDPDPQRCLPEPNNFTEKDTFRTHVNCNFSITVANLKLFCFRGARDEGGKYNKNQMKIDWRRGGGGGVRKRFR